MKNIARSLLDGSMTGIASGLFISLFLYGLSFITNTFQANPSLLYALPIIIFITAWFYQKNPACDHGSHKFIAQANQQKQILPLLMVPTIFIFTLLAHLFGASIGREASAVQISAGLSNSIARFANYDEKRKRRMIIAGMGAGFGAAIGAPLAGAIFGMEVLTKRLFKFEAMIESLTAAFIAFAITHLLKVPHTIYPNVNTYFSWTTLTLIPLAAIFFGLISYVFLFFTSFVSKLFQNSLTKAFLLGIILVVCFKIESSTLYNGLGLEVIVRTFHEQTDIKVFLYKIFFTGLSVASGLKGGEFTPLAYIGATAGSALAFYLPVSTSLFAGLGFSAVFAAAANTPIACAIMAAELFGLAIFPYALVTCIIASLVCSKRHLYQNQRSS